MEPKKKMTMMQLTVIVAVNMMGSGIIMLPANMAKVGAISLLSWVVTALGSMAIAYGFAQAGLFNQRARAACRPTQRKPHGKAGFFHDLSISISSRWPLGMWPSRSLQWGISQHFFPWLSSTPVATCVGVIGLIWLTTVANFGGPSLDWADRFSDGVGSDSFPLVFFRSIGWFWFSG